MVTACVVGDMTNSGKNHVAAINTEGWLFIFSMDLVKNPTAPTTSRQGGSTTDDARTPMSSPSVDSSGIKLEAIYQQRMPANCKELLLADLDGDGQNEVIVGLTDRVLRTYKWIKIGPDRGKFVGLYKWEFADQIGAVSLNPSQHENCLDIIVAQPGGTYAKLECSDKKPIVVSDSSNNGSSKDKVREVSEQGSAENLNDDDDNVRTEYISKLTPEYHQLALTQMRNHHISTEVLGGIRDGKSSNSFSLIVIATLDGTLMLVDKDQILWSLQVDHQLFALAVLESKMNRVHSLSQSESTCTIVPVSNSDSNDLRDSNRDYARLISQYLVVCAWNGKTYIIDEDRNYLRFKFDEAVSAFTAGNYHFDGVDHASLVYATFNNQIVLYYDVIHDHIRPMYLLDEVLHNQDNADLLAKLGTLTDMLENQGELFPRADLSGRVRGTLQDILYSITDEELKQVQPVE